MSKHRKIKLLVSVFIYLTAISSLVSADTRSRSEASDRPMPVQDIFDEKQAQVETVADSLEYSRKDNTLIAKGNVVITHGTDKITADYAEVDTETKKAFAKGHVIIFSKDVAKVSAPEVHYDFDNHTGNFPQGSIISQPWRCKGTDMRQVKEGVQKADDAVLTTCKGENPPYEIRAKKVTIYERDKLIARNVTIYSLGKPIFWWPYLIVPLQDRSMPFSVHPGYNSRHGAYIELTKGIGINKNMYGKLHADWRSKRGFGTGGDLDYDYDKWGRGVVRGYWTQDERAPTPGLENPFSELEDRDRGRITWLHRTDIDPDSHILLRYNRLADEYFLQEFFEKEHRSEVEPQSFVTLTKNSQHYGFLVHASKRMNRFESLVERLPEVRLDWKNQPFFVPWLFYQNQTSYAGLSKRFGRMPHNQDVSRVDHLSQWWLPIQYHQIKFTPFLNARGTYYSRDKDSDDNHMRLVAGAGVDLRTQFYKTFNTHFEKMGIEVNQLRHVFEPSIRYETAKSTVSDETLDHFDSIDTLDDRDIITFGIENRLQTKRVINGRLQRVDIVSLNTYLSYEFNTDVEDSSSTFTTFSPEIVLRPYNWLLYQAKLDYNLQIDGVKQFNQDLIVRTPRFNMVFGHRYVNNIQDIEGSNQFIFDARVMLNSLWSLGGYLRWDAQGQDLEEWQVSATRDMDCLLLDFGYDVRNSSIDGSHKELFFELRLKDFPEMSIRGGGSRATFAQPRIGETVAGSNQLGSMRDYFQERYAPRTS